jgi:hypothetical protein
MRFLFIVIIISSLCITEAVAQHKENANWLVATNINAQQIFFSDTGIAQFPLNAAPISLHNYSGAHSCLSDTAGNFQLACTGSKLINKYHQLVPNGDTLVDALYYDYYNGAGLLYSTQGSIILRCGYDSVFKVFTISWSDAEWNNANASHQPERLLMTEVNPWANNDSGLVLRKKVLIDDTKYYSLVGMSACRHSNGIDWWLLKQAENKNAIFAYLVTKDSVYPAIENAFTKPQFKTSLYGQMSVSQQGDQVAYVQSKPNQVFVGSFDRCYGQVSNPRVFDIPRLLVDYTYDSTTTDTIARGLAFSPNGRFLYVVMSSKIFQLDLQTSDTNNQWYLVSSIDTAISSFTYFYIAALAPDSNIYIGRLSAYDSNWSFIEDPDLKGAACNFRKRGLKLLSSNFKTPPNVINYALGAKNCWPLTIENGSAAAEEIESEVRVYPNPASSELRIENGELKMKELYDCAGKRLLLTEKDIIDVSKLARGLYFVKVSRQVIKVVIE